MCAYHCRNPIFCILPGFILKSVIEKGTPEQRQAALATLSSDSTFRTMRAFLSASNPPSARRRRRIGLGPAKQRTISTARNLETLPGKMIRGEGMPVAGDVAVDEAYDGLGQTFDFFWENYQRNSIDDEGLPLSATVHYGKKYNNAFWNGQRMVFGDGDGKLFNRFTLSLDVIGHELGHGVTEDETCLAYIQQPGALNEHLSDVWRSLIKQWVRKQTADKADWLIGEGLLAAGVRGKALRSMKAPGTAFDDPVLGKDPQPDHMDNYVDTFADHGGVHINSNIPNRAFYLAATTIGGHAWEKPGLIWYQTVRDPRVSEGTKFAEFAAITIDVANRLPGIKKSEAKAVADAWARVGVVVTS